MENKSYNPFKMWGSYVGALIGLIILNTIPLYGTIIGFLIGWAVHSFFKEDFE